MSDDWRLRTTFAEGREAAALAERLQRGDLEHRLADQRVIVSRDDRDVFVYADGREQAEAAAEAVDELARREGWSCSSELAHWHPEAEEWEDPDTPLPSGPGELAAEHADRTARERAESSRLGVSEYEVRIECDSHHDTVALAERLEREGLEPVRRWRYLLIGAADEDSAHQLADRLASEAPAGSQIRVEGSLAAVAAELPPNPFRVFGGLGL